MKEARRRENIAGYIFMAPSLLFFLGFVIFPMGMCLVTSFFYYTMTDFSFIGLNNYKEMFGDPIFSKALVNTIIIVVVSVPVTCMFSLWVASIIFKMRPLHTSFFRCVFYLPVVTGSVAVTVVWKWIFNNYTGVLNYLFKSLGIISKNMNWLGDPSTALWCIITILLTTSVGQPIVLYVSALSNVDHSLTEAASDSGHHHHQQLPVLRPDPAADLGRTQQLHPDHHVLHLLSGLQAEPLRLRQRHGHHPGHHHCRIQRHSVQTGQDR